jgi:predicted component of type VI protein secretion system
MDATRLRALIEGALAAQSEFDAASRREEAARDATQRAAERCRNEVNALEAVLNGAVVVFGDKLVRVGSGSGGFPVRTLIATPLVSVPVAAPPPAPLPEADPPVERKAITSDDIAATALNKDSKAHWPIPVPPAPPKTPVPTSGGTIPTLGKKK